VNKLPDKKTVWFFRENLTNSELIPLLFNPFIEFIEDKNLMLNEVKMVDAGFTIAPRQQNTKDKMIILKKEKVMIYGMTIK
jgi:hypothetical protein